jgi:hypothetical protein
MTAIALSCPNLAAASGRSRRVAGLLTLASVFGAADLGLTLHAMMTTGMLEDNPLVLALVRETGSPLSLVVFKLVTMVMGVGLLYRLRRCVSAEVGAAVGAVALGAVVVLWVLYWRSFDGVDLMALRHQIRDAHWIRL